MSLKGDNVSKKCNAVLRYKSADPGIVNVFTYRSAVLRLTLADSSKCPLRSWVLSENPISDPIQAFET